MGGNTHAFFFILNLTLMHRKFDQNRKALLQRTLPRLFSLPSVIRKSAATVWPAAIHVSSFPPHKESCAQNRSLGWSSLKRESSEMGAGAFLLPFSPFYPAWLAITALLPQWAMSPAWRRRKSLGCLLMAVWIFLQVLECHTSNFYLNAK